MKLYDGQVKLTETAKGVLYDHWADRKLTKTRIYTDVTEQEVKEQYGLDKPEYTIYGEDPENDKAWKKYNRAEVAIMKTKVTNMLHSFVDFDGVTVKFSRKAGCSCPCSPGFVASVLLRNPLSDKHEYLKSIHLEG